MLLENIALDFLATGIHSDMPAMEVFLEKIQLLLVIVLTSTHEVENK